MEQVLDMSLDEIIKANRNKIARPSKAGVQVKRSAPKVRHPALRGDRAGAGQESGPGDAVRGELASQLARKRVRAAPSTSLQPKSRSRVDTAGGRATWPAVIDGAGHGKAHPCLSALPPPPRLQAVPTSGMKSTPGSIGALKRRVRLTGRAALPWGSSAF